ncbi:hypothetical protein GCM10012289_30000 [Nonomuraea cavernae]|uniref:Uncharacterized protein n=1 Tax=Nonomuraea cavernae TaxID=2045107 RepID=A0A917YXA9_9ACTN|nr:hypothetical protein GCM10012289_30000 [Nonomuraea cavernae]
MSADLPRSPALRASDAERDRVIQLGGPGRRGGLKGGNARYLEISDAFGAADARGDVRSWDI